MGIDYLLQAARGSQSVEVRQLAEALELVGRGIGVKGTSVVSANVGQPTLTRPVITDVPFAAIWSPRAEQGSILKMRLTGGLTVLTPVGLNENEELTLYLEADGTNRVAQFDIWYQSTAPLTITINANCKSVLRFIAYRPGTGGVVGKMLSSLLNQPI